jgi:hypothetical protein
MYHIMVYSSEERGVYSYPYAVHFFANSKIPPATAFERANKIIKDTFGAGPQNRYVGYEELPVSVPEFYVATKFDSDMSLEKFVAEPRIPEMREVTDYRLSRLTVDIDENADFKLAKALDKVRELQLPFSLYRTARGYHVRATLPRVYDFQTLMSLRDSCMDDFSRREIDESYHKAGLDFLTNFLFNEKYWIEGSEIKGYAEREVNLREVTVARKGEISIELPKLSISGRISIEVDKGVVTARGPADILTKEYFDLIRQSIEDNLWEYSLRKEQEEDVKTKIINGYAKISPKAAFIASKCDTEVNYSIVTLKVPPELSDYIGILIGKEGKNIKAVQEETGLKIVIARPPETAKPKTEEEKMREKLQEMLKSLV